MSHHIYQTKAFVIDSMDVGEANKLLTLFTADLGLISVSAQSVRVMQSKLRPSIQDLSFSKVALVRGKEYWRLTSAEKLISLYDKRVSLPTRQFMARSLQFVKRLTTGESKHEELFDMLSRLFTFCFENSKDFTSDSLKALALVTDFRILESLGYGSDDEDFDEIRDALVWNMGLLQKFQDAGFRDEGSDDAEFENKAAGGEKLREKIQKHITKALASSHL
jgi:DNA repair protein RecO